MGEGLSNYLPRLDLNCDLPDLTFPSNWDYRHEPLTPGLRFLRFSIEKKNLYMLVSVKFL
jgi:hypothetical protein